MKNHESNSESRNSSFDSLEEGRKKTSWADHLKKAKELISGLARGKNNERGEDNAEKSYKLTDLPKYKGFDIAEEWDKTGPEIPQEVGKMVEFYVNNPDFVFGIHRSDAINGADFENDDVLESIMTEGLVNLGDASSGSIREAPDVSKTVSLPGNILNSVIYMKSSYKRSTGAVLVAIPSKYLDEDGGVMPGMENEVYNQKGKNSYLKPEFILGFASNVPGEKTSRFKSREDLLKEYSERSSEQ